MSVYFLAKIEVEDPVEYQKYLDACDAIFAHYRGEYLAVDESPKVLEGEWSGSRTVLIRFPDEAEFFRWYHSAEYQKILRHRLRGARCETVLVKGKN
ncbi:dimeric alpha-beta barrel [Lucifera butyrica]|uniref:Dimeric alpha-beta barrel n=1 Tax=Lucifera butyrica TaxID=1351585 RepID=A0A498R7Y7_9FIRM|nr:DUF1330 domain-containing protein [Lucifera butyrica]VBB07299.1 dimeric alpha-beta barrel [Lucifera butyrica]